MQEILNSLNPDQAEAVRHTHGPLLILAGAGSGKTRVITHRIAHLISSEGVAPWNILAITFTNKAAEEMRERVDRLCEESAAAVWVATFHATCVRILRRHAELLGYTHNFGIYDTDDQRTLMKRVTKALDMDPKMYPERMLLAKISAAKNERITPDEMGKEAAGEYRAMRIADAYVEYQRQLMENDAMDFDDLLTNAVQLFEEHPEVLADYQNRWKYILVDEYQDTNTVQFELVRLLAAKHRNLCVVGDDDQSIYKFRGANIRNILDFEKTYPEAKVVRLEQNYRSTGNILDTANAVIRHNKGRKIKSLWTQSPAGDPVDYREFETAYDEAEAVIRDISDNRIRFAYGDCAVLYRTNAQSRLLEEKCVLNNVPYRLIGGVNFYQRKEIKDIIAYLKTVNTGTDDLAVQRIINVPKRGIGQTTVTRAAQFAAEQGLGFYEALTRCGEIDGLGRAAAEKIRGFVQQIEALREQAAETPVKELIDRILETTGYRRELEAEKTVEAQTRLENILELMNKAAELPEDTGPEALNAFLEEVALIADVDTLNDDENRVVLMTLHGAKGLEFPRVYICGMEEGLFPSSMAMNSGDEEDIEEERRLCYVGITRAKEKLTLTAARRRMVNGETRFSRPSRFVEEIPAQLLEKTVAGGATEHFARDAGRGFGARSPYGAGASYGAGPASGRRPSAPATGGTTFADLYTGKSLVIDSEGDLGYGEGDRVRHVKFGEGTVLHLEKGRRDYEVTVEFDGAGTKKLFAAFAKLVKIE